MPVSQAQFDQDLAAYIAADQNQEQLVNTYIAAVTAFIGHQAVIDLSAEDAEVATALAAVTASQQAVQTAQSQLPPPPGPAKPAA